jgi:membrane protease YdiL (CAAX protease family)
VILSGQVEPIATEPVRIDQISTPAEPVVALALASLLAWAWAIGKVRRREPPLAYEGRKPVPWTGADVAIVFLALYGVFLLCQGLLLQLSDARGGAGGKVSDALQARFFAGQSISELTVMLLAIGLLMRRQRGADWKDLGFDLRHFGRDLAAGVVGFVLIAAPINVLYALLEKKELHPLIELTMRQPSLLWLIGVCAVLVAPLVEEFFFRVVLQGWLEGRQRAVPREDRLFPWMPTGMMPILISSVLFAGAHAGQWPAPIPLFFLALVLGYLYHQTHRLLPSLVVHMLLNGGTFLTLWWAVHSGAIGGK